MDHENSLIEEKANSLFQVDRTFLKKILARKSFVGQSKRMFHTENVVSVPFDWEMQPGTPKHFQSEIPPPIKPPPVVQSHTLEKPSLASTTHTTTSCFWKKSRRSHCQGEKTAKAKGRGGYSQGNNATDGNKGNDIKSVESWDGNVDSMSSSDHSRSSSSSSSVSTSSSCNSTTISSSSSSSLRSFAKGFMKWSF